MPTLNIIVTSTRPGRLGPTIGSWFFERAREHGAFALEQVDLAEVNLPLFDEPKHPRLREYAHEHTRRWSAITDAADAFVFVVPEYNHAAPPSLVNALDFLVHEWAYKPAGFVSYGGVSGGTRAMAVAKQMLTALKVVPLFEAVNIPFVGSQIENGAIRRSDTQDTAARTMLDELARWSAALQQLRAPRS